MLNSKQFIGNACNPVQVLAEVQTLTLTIYISTAAAIIGQGCVDRTEILINQVPWNLEYGLQILDSYGC